MAIREIVHIPDNILRQVSKPVERVDAALLSVLDDMLETMYEAPGIGLAGIQIALPLRMITIDIGDPKDEEAHNVALIKWHQAVEAAEATGEEPPERPKRKKAVKRPIFLINPKIVKYSDELSTYEEGCLSIPEYYADVERPADCLVEYIDRNAKPQQLAATGILSTCIQHEVDHLDGTLFIDHISKLKREMVVKKFSKIAKQSGKGPASPLVL